MAKKKPPVKKAPLRKRATPKPVPDAIAHAPISHDPATHEEPDLPAGRIRLYLRVDLPRRLAEALTAEAAHRQMSVQELATDLLGLAAAKALHRH